MGRIVHFLGFIGDILSGGRLYSLWLFILSFFALIGLHAYAYQLSHGLVTTGMTDEVSWGFYIANLVFLVGMAAAAVMLVIPAYLFAQEDVKKVAIFAELFAIVAIIMCILFVSVDLGRIDRFWHLIPFIGVFHWPQSMLTWDIIVLNGYLVLNVLICGYLVVKTLRGESVNSLIYMVLVLISIVWAPSIHIVTAFLFEGLGGRPFWHSGLVAPRFLASAFAAGPAFIILVFDLINRYTNFKVSYSAIRKIRNIVAASLIINLILIASEVFAELYIPTVHSIHMSLLLGFSGWSVVTPWMWIAISMMLAAVFVFVTPLRDHRTPLLLACVFTVVGIWLEKGLGFLIPGFIPSPLGDFVDYVPTLNEILIVIGVWALGLLIYTLLVKGVLLVIDKNQEVLKDEPS